MTIHKSVQEWAAKYQVSLDEMEAAMDMMVERRQELSRLEAEQDVQAAKITLFDEEFKAATNERNRDAIVKSKTVDIRQAIAEQAGALRAEGDRLEILRRRMRLAHAVLLCLAGMGEAAKGEEEVEA